MMSHIDIQHHQHYTLFALNNIYALDCDIINTLKIVVVNTRRKIFCTPDVDYVNTHLCYEKTPILVAQAEYSMYNHYFQLYNVTFHNDSYKGYHLPLSYCGPFSSYKLARVDFDAAMNITDIGFRYTRDKEGYTDTECFYMSKTDIPKYVLSTSQNLEPANNILIGPSPI
jgi:hypothetical protein